MNDAIVQDLENQMLSAITRGANAFVIWGFSEEAIGLIAALNQRGLLNDFVVGIIDTRSQYQGKRVFNLSITHPREIAGLIFDTLVIALDEDKETALREFASHDSRIPEVILSGTGHFAFRDPIFAQMSSNCLVKSYANGYENSLIHIYQSITFLAKNKIKGNVAEFGIFKGGTVSFIAKTLRQFGLTDVQIYGFDIFDGFPKSRTIFDLYRDPKCEFKDYASVEQYCEANGIHVVKGDICDTYKVLADIPLMLSFFDTDNYSPAKAALELVYQNTVKGGIIAFDHYVSEGRFIYTIGERMAANEILVEKGMLNLYGTGIFLKL